MKRNFGGFVKEKRMALHKYDKSFSLRQVAARIGVQPSYLSRIERGDQLSLSEEKAIALAKELNIDPDIMLAMAGKVSKELQEIIRKRPELFAELIRNLKEMPDYAVLKIAREVRDGNW